MIEIDGIINSFYDGLWICDSDGRVIKINKAAEKINCIEAEHVIGKNAENLIQAGLIDRSVTLEVLKTKTTVTILQQLKGGKRILVTGSPVFDQQRRISLVVVNERDITELNRLRDELEESRALAHRYYSNIYQLEKEKHLSSKVVARSEVMSRVLNMALRVAQVDSTVMIYGDSGVGKGFFARLIHESSPRQNGPYIRVDCCAIPETLIESELFGYEKGAFTGALPGGKPGQLELAGGGTLFLDEIGDLSPNVQVKLLRFLEDNKIMRVGSTVPKEISIRVIAATNRNLDDLVRKGDFRGDLFFRLNVIPIYIPPLRERVDDIPLFIQFFLEKFNQKYSTNKVILRAALDCISQYPFPGNIRELSNLIEQLGVLTEAKNIRREDLPMHVRFSDSRLINNLEKNADNLRKAVKKLEKEMIIRALRSYGSQRKASRFLGVHQSTLARKVRRYGITSDAIMHIDA